MRANHGFTLIEMVIGMVVFAIVMTIVTNLVVIQSRRSVDPILQVRAAELAQSISAEMLAKAFDEHSSRAGNASRCNETAACSPSSLLGPDTAESRALFDDVDDFHHLDEAGAGILDSRGQPLLLNGQGLYQGFRARISVVYDDNLDGINDDDANNDGVNDTGAYVGNVKLVTVIVTTPANEDITFAFHRWNY